MLPPMRLHAAALYTVSIPKTSAAVMGLYVQADADFFAQLVYTAPDGSTLTKALHVVIDRSRTMPHRLQRPQTLRLRRAPHACRYQR